jgi:adenosylcobinamide-GDP ribazoletransferase
MGATVGRLVLQARAFLAAVQFLTRIPVPSFGRDSDEAAADLRRGEVYIPLVGGLVGLSTAGVILAASYLWPTGIAVVLGLAWEAWLTGALHEDAVADFCDAFGGGWTKEDLLRILKDSRIGSYGMVGLGLALLLRAGTLASLSSIDLLAAGAASGALGRWLSQPVMALVPPLADRPSLARDLGQTLTGREVFLGLLAAMLAALPFGLLAPLRLAAALAGMALFLCWFVPYLRRRLGGVTGDCLGFACYAGQLIVLLAASAGR